jgi:hypothetical protein
LFARLHSLLLSLPPLVATLSIAIHEYKIILVAECCGR